MLTRIRPRVPLICASTSSDASQRVFRRRVGHHVAMESDEFRSTLALVDTAVWAGVIFPEHLPSIATSLLSDETDTPTLRALAGLDLEPFDPRDARDSFRDLLAESSIEPLPIEKRVDAAAKLISFAYQQGRLTTSRLLRRFQQLAIASDYPDHDEVMRLYALDDEWRGEWGRTRDEMEADALELTGRLAIPPPPLDVLIDAVIDSE